MPNTGPLHLSSHPGLWQFWSLSTTPGLIWVAPLDAPARKALAKKGAGTPLLEVAAGSVQAETDDTSQPTLF
jgi:hypothetical protein